MSLHSHVYTHTDLLTHTKGNVKPDFPREVRMEIQEAKSFPGYIKYLKCANNLPNSKARSNLQEQL